jgi:thiamine biosynthesis protein ThiI
MQEEIHYIVRYSGELGTKDKATRWKLIHRLENNIRSGIRQRWSKSLAQVFSIKGGWDKLSIKSPLDMTDILSKTPGISKYYQIYPFEYLSSEDIIKQAVSFFKPLMNKKRFAVRCKKSGLIPFKSKMIETEVGGELYKYGKVDLTNPEVTCNIEVYADHYFLFCNKGSGLGGMPIGSQGQALCLLSGGFDSSVATWNMYKAGVDMDFVYFDLGGEAQKDCIINSFFYLKNHWGHGSKSKLFIIDFIDIVRHIKNGRPAFQNMILKYAFYKCGEQLAKNEKKIALVTGESIGQVSTQTLKNLCALDQVCDIPILRPLCTLDKNTIITKAREIGTHDLAYKGQELCAIGGKGVTTGTSYKKLIQAVKPLNIDEVMNKALDGIVQIKDNEKEAKKAEDIIPEYAEIIDIRNSKEFEKGSLKKAENIPFDQAIQEFYHWDKSKEYFLVCNVGSLSAVLANSMLNEKFNVKHLKSGLKAFK